MTNAERQPILKFPKSAIHAKAVAEAEVVDKTEKKEKEKSGE